MHGLHAREGALGKVSGKRLARVSLFLGGGDHGPVLYERRGVIVMEGRQPEDTHSGDSEQRIDEGRDAGALGEHNQTAEQHHGEEDRQQPVLPSHAQETPELERSDHGLEPFRTGAGRSAYDGTRAKQKYLSRMPPRPA